MPQPGPDPDPLVDASQARDLLVRAETATPATARDRHRHALGLLAAGVVMAGVAAAGVMMEGPWSILGSAGTWVLAVGLILGIGTITDRASASTPRGMARSTRIASWIAFAVLVVGRVLLDALVGDAPPSPLAVLLLGLAVLLPLAAAAHRIWWGGWLPGRTR